MGDSYEVSTFRIILFKGDTRTASYKILASEDGVTYTDATEVLTSSGTSIDFEKVVFSPALSNMRYIRVAGYGNSNEGSDWNSFSEVEIFGILSSSVGLEDISLLEKGISIFPNPVVGNEIKIKSEDRFIESYKIFNISGKLILEGDLNSKEGTINLTMLKKGNYVLLLPNIGATKFLKN